MTLALPSFRAIDAAHHAVRGTGRKALIAFAAGYMAVAQRCIAEMRQHSERVLLCLDEFGYTYPATISGEAVAA